ncbi:hypothetical protein B0H13DRAFT_725658 [Mycena leptocephala]|nr:hypothetical protein B0H13DRAFT_725658 [Mycena leptocephala]
MGSPAARVAFSVLRFFFWTPDPWHAQTIRCLLDGCTVDIIYLWVFLDYISNAEQGVPLNVDPSARLSRYSAACLITLSSSPFGHLVSCAQWRRGSAVIIRPFAHRCCHIFVFFVAP